MSKKIISPESLEIKELEEKIAPFYFSNVLVDNLWSGVDSYTIGDNSWHWDYTANNMGSYLGYNYDPIGLIGGSSSVGSSVNVLNDSLWSSVDSYTVGDNSWHWGYTASNMSNYLSYNYDPMSIIYGSSWLY
jgi:hypothetical protein